MSAEKVVSQRELDRVIARVVDELRGGLAHGFFEITVTSEIIQGRKRRVVVKAGRSYVFVVPSEEVDV